MATMNVSLPGSLKQPARRDRKRVKKAASSAGRGLKFDANMKPRLVTTSNEVLQTLTSCVSGIDCSTLYKRTDLAKTKRVRELQSVIKAALERDLPEVEWSEEHTPNPKYRDRIDIYGKGENFAVVVELDTTRADQVAKKFVSRLAILPSTQVYYLSVCYPGTRNMNPKECKKYFGYCSTLARRMGCQYAGFIISPG